MSEVEELALLADMAALEKARMRGEVIRAVCSSSTWRVDIGDACGHGSTLIGAVRAALADFRSLRCAQGDAA